MINRLLADDIINLRPSPAAGDETKTIGSLTNLEISDIIGGGIKLVVVVAAVIFFFILVIGGIKWIASGGDKARTESARSQITAALVGLVIVFAAWAIVALINTFFGVNIFSLTIPTV